MNGAIALFLTSNISIHQPLAVRRPSGRSLLICSHGNLPWLSTLSRDHEYAPWPGRFFGHQGDPLAVRRPSRQFDFTRLNLNLLCSATVGATNPHRVTRKSHVYNPAPIF